MQSKHERKINKKLSKKSEKQHSSFKNNTDVFSGRFEVVLQLWQLM